MDIYPKPWPEGVKTYVKRSDGKCYPSCKSGYKLELVGGEWACVKTDDETCACDDFDCAVLNDGLLLDDSCGDYGGYFVPYEDTVTAPVPCGKTGSPLFDIAQLVKRASDRGDVCNQPEPPTLWEQKHLAYQIAGDGETNIVCKNSYNDRSSKLSTLLETLTNSFPPGENVLRSDYKFIDFDMIYDVMILRQEVAPGVETYLADRVSYDYNTGQIKLGIVTGKHIKIYKFII